MHTLRAVRLLAGLAARLAWVAAAVAGVAVAGCTVGARCGMAGSGLGRPSRLIVGRRRCREAGRHLGPWQVTAVLVEREGAHPAAPGDVVHGGVRVFLVGTRGHLVASDAWLPPGAAARSPPRPAEPRRA